MDKDAAELQPLNRPAGAMLCTGGLSIVTIPMLSCLLIGFALLAGTSDMP